MAFLPSIRIASQRIHQSQLLMRLNSSCDMHSHHFKLRPLRKDTFFTAFPRNFGLFSRGAFSNSRTLSTFSDLGSITCSAVVKAKKNTDTSLTFLEGNSWLLENGGKRIYVDPWLCGNLEFLNQPWLFSGRKSAVPNDLVDDANPGGQRPADVILLSQAIDDHFHEPTLQRLDKNIPVIASPKAAARIKSLGFKRVVSLAPGQSHNEGAFTFLATAGALVGPPWEEPENGFIIGVPAEDFQLYYEPHGQQPPGVLDSLPRVDAVVTPVIKASFPLLGNYTLVAGIDSAIEIVRKLQPTVVVPFLNARHEATGFLSGALTFEGSPEGFEEELRRLGLTAEVMVPEWGVPLSLDMSLKVPA